MTYSLEHQIQRGKQHSESLPRRAWDGSCLIHGMTPFWYVLTVVQPMDDEFILQVKLACCRRCGGQGAVPGPFGPMRCDLCNQ